MLNEDEIKEELKGFEIKLENKSFRNRFLKKLSAFCLANESTEEKCIFLNAIGALYFLYPDSFQDYSEVKMEIIKNPYERFLFISKTNLNQENILSYMNYDLKSLKEYNENIDQWFNLADSSDSDEFADFDILDNHKNPNPFFTLDYSNAEWIFKKIVPGQKDSYGLFKIDGNWHIKEIGHARTSIEYKLVVISYLSDLKII